MHLLLCGAFAFTPIWAGTASARADCNPACLAAGDSTTRAALDSDSDGGDGIAGLVIGIADVRDSIVTAMNLTDHSSVEGGDADSTNKVSMSAGATILISGGTAGSVAATSGDGVLGRVVGVESEEATVVAHVAASGTLRPSPGAVGRAVAFAVGPAADSPEDAGTSERGRPAASDGLGGTVGFSVGP